MTRVDGDLETLEKARALVAWNSLEELTKQPLPSTLWHYTSLGGLYGILQSQRIYATDIRFLNDHKEFGYTVQMIAGMSEGLPDMDSDGFPYKQVFHDVTKSVLGGLTENAYQVFVTSFSAARDTLSQWRAYSHSSPGVSLGFDLTSIRGNSTQRSLQTVAPCLYSEADQKRLVRLVVREYIAISKLLWSKGLDYGRKKDIPPLVPAYGFTDAGEVNLHTQHAKAQLEVSLNLILAACLCKHPAFHEEDEWRLTIPFAPGRPREFRVGHTHLIPYIAERLVAHPRTDLPLVDLILGPDSPAESGVSCSMFLESQGFKFKPRTSSIPFRTR